METTRDPVALLETQAASRVPELVPIRYGRMSSSPFAFYRGAAAVMAADLAGTPVSGLHVQLCGDAHLANFGLFASPERALLFDVNDFDETIAGPWEWDLARLVTSLVVAGRSNGYDERDVHGIAAACTRRYRETMAMFAQTGHLEVWYARATVDEIRRVLRDVTPKKRRKKFDATVSRARANDRLKAARKLTTTVDGTPRIKAEPPLLVPVGDLLPEMDRAALEGQVVGLLQEYRTSLPSDRAFLLDRYRFVDMARKVVGVGSVGTRCWVVLLQGRDENDPLLLQVKEAQQSVLAPYLPRPREGTAAPTVPAHDGARVVAGQRLMQAASDIFLGWETVTGIDGRVRDFYVRQLRDQKGSADVTQMRPQAVSIYGELCAWTLARAHARSGDAAAITDHLGRDGDLDAEMSAFAERYADQNEADHAALVEAIGSGRLLAEVEA
ncbi:MAG TPA: DUF2252 domain-containing protein [Nocardioidaceae bacterium]|nr:DUF2252 domain-containing protein [Nocardioidaceae bacterium]